MPRFRRPPLTLADLRFDGPPVRLRDLAAITTLSYDTLHRDIKATLLHAYKRKPGEGSPYFIDRDVARQYLTRMGFTVDREPKQGAVVVMAERRTAVSRA